MPKHKRQGAIESGENGTGARLGSLLQEARRAAAGEAVGPAGLIQATDREVLRALRKAEAPERAGLVALLASLGARAQRIAEQAVAAEGFGDDARSELLGFLRARQPDHPLPRAFDSLEAALRGGDIEAAREHVSALPGTLLTMWARQRGCELVLSQGPASLRWLEEIPLLATGILEALNRNTPSGTLEALAQVARVSGSRPLRKAVRTTFFRLAQQDVKVPELPAATPVAPAQGEPRLESRAFVSAIDGAGDQVVWVLEELPEGGYSVLEGVIGNDGSLASTRAVVLTRRGYANLCRDLTSDRALPLTELPVPVAMSLLEDAYATNPTGTGSDYRHWRQMAGTARRAKPAGLPEVAQAEQARWLARSEELLHTEPCRHWLLPRPETEEAEKLLADSRSVLVLPPREEARRHEEALVRALERLLPRGRLDQLARRFETVATMLQAADGGGGRTQDMVRSALAVAAALRDGQLATIPALSELLRRSLAALEQTRALERERAGVIRPGAPQAR